MHRIAPHLVASATRNDGPSYRGTRGRARVETEWRGAAQTGPRSKRPPGETAGIRAIPGAREKWRGWPAASTAPTTGTIRETKALFSPPSPHLLPADFTILSPLLTSPLSARDVLPRRRAIRPDEFHLPFRILRRGEPKPGIQALRIGGPQGKAADGAQIRMRQHLS